MAAEAAPWSEIVNMTASGETYLLLHALKLYRKVDPDDNTLSTALGVTDVSTIRTVSDADMNSFLRGDPIPNGILDKRSGTPDDLMRVIQARSILLKPQDWWLESHFLPNVFNPSFVRWHGKILMSWRSMAVKGNQASTLEFGWLNSHSFSVNETDAYRGIDRTTRVQVKQDTDYNKLQDDPRLMLLHDNSVLVTYASVYESANRFSIFRWVLDHSTGQAIMCCHKQLSFLGPTGSGSI